MTTASNTLNGLVRHQDVTVNQVRLHYVEAGKGKPVIFLHGFPEFWYGWKHQLPFFAENYHVIAPDMRGYNDSEKPKGVSNYQTLTIATDIKELINKLGYEKAHIVGHDWGAAIAWALAQAYPEVVDKLVILNCPPAQILSKHLYSNLAQLKRSWYIFFFQLPWLPEWFLSRNMQKFFTQAFIGWTHHKNAFTQEDIDIYVKAFQKKGAVNAAINYYRAGRYDLFRKPAYHRNKVLSDTFVIWGEDDQALGKELTDDFPSLVTGKYRITYIPDCSHWVQHEYPEKVNQLIAAFLNESHHETKNKTSETV